MGYGQAHKEALERARQVHTTNVDEDKKLAECIFPELKESKDEKIRKEIIGIIKSQKEQQCHIEGAIFDELIAWL